MGIFCGRQASAPSAEACTCAPTTRTMLKLHSNTRPEWVSTVLGDFDTFLLDHAACERKASSMAMSFVVRYPDRDAIHDPMILVAREELAHFHQVFRFCMERGLRFSRDQKDPYVSALMKLTRHGRDDEFLDRLVLGAVVEARGHERFGCIAEHLDEGPLQKFYAELTRSEARHAEIFLELAEVYFPPEDVSQRVEFFLVADAQICSRLPVRAALH